MYIMFASIMRIRQPTLALKSKETSLEIQNKGTSGPKIGHMCPPKKKTKKKNSDLLLLGTVPSLAAQISENAVLFMAYGLCQKSVAWVVGAPGGDPSRLTPLQKACAGSAGGFFCSLTLCPTELIKCKQQAMREKINAGLVQKVTMKDMCVSYGFTTTKIEVFTNAHFSLCWQEIT